MLKSSIVVFYLFLVVTTSFSQELPKGYINLFDGNTLAGWHIFKKPGLIPAWDIQDGAIHLDPTKKEGRGDLVTNFEFEDNSNIDTNTLSTTSFVSATQTATDTEASNSFGKVSI